MAPATCFLGRVGAVICARHPTWIAPCIGPRTSGTPLLAPCALAHPAWRLVIEAVPPAWRTGGRFVNLRPERCCRLLSGLDACLHWRGSCSVDRRVTDTAAATVLVKAAPRCRSAARFPGARAHATHLHRPVPAGAVPRSLPTHRATIVIWSRVWACRLHTVPSPRAFWRLARSPRAPGPASTSMQGCMEASACLRGAQVTFGVTPTSPHPGTVTAVVLPWGPGGRSAHPGLVAPPGSAVQSAAPFAATSWRCPPDPHPLALLQTPGLSGVAITPRSAARILAAGRPLGAAARPIRPCSASSL